METKFMYLWMVCQQCGETHFIFDLIDKEQLDGPHNIGAYRHMMHQENCPDCNMSFAGGKYLTKGCSSEHFGAFHLYGYPDSDGVEVIVSPNASQELTQDVVSTIGHLERVLAELKNKLYKITE